MDDIINALLDDNRAEAIDQIKSALFDKASSYVDLQRQHIANSVFSDVVGAEESDTEVDVDSEQQEEEPTSEEQEDETNYGDD